MVPEKRDKKHESQAEFEQRKRRALELRRFVKAVDLTEIHSRSVRDSLEHFDQKLDRFVVAERGGHFKKRQAFAVQNFVFSSWSAPEEYEQMEGAQIVPIKVYVASEQTYHNFDAKVRLSHLRDEALGIVDVCRDRGAMAGQEDGYAEMGVIHALNAFADDT